MEYGKDGLLHGEVDMPEGDVAKRIMDALIPVYEPPTYRQKPEKNFEDFLGMKAMADYHGDKDHWENYFEGFLEDLQIDDMIKYADEYADTIRKSV